MCSLGLNGTFVKKKKGKKSAKLPTITQLTCNNLRLNAFFSFPLSPKLLGYFGCSFFLMCGDSLFLLCLAAVAKRREGTQPHSQMICGLMTFK